MVSSEMLWPEKAARGEILFLMPNMCEKKRAGRRIIRTTNKDVTDRGNV